MVGELPRKPDFCVRAGGEHHVKLMFNFQNSARTGFSVMYMIKLFSAMLYITACGGLTRPNFDILRSHAFVHAGKSQPRIIVDLGIFLSHSNFIIPSQKFVTFKINRRCPPDFRDDAQQCAFMPSAYWLFSFRC